MLICEGSAPKVSAPKPCRRREPAGPAGPSAALEVPAENTGNPLERKRSLGSPLLLILGRLSWILDDTNLVTEHSVCEPSYSEENRARTVRFSHHAAVLEEKAPFKF